MTHHIKTHESAINPVNLARSVKSRMLAFDG